VRLLSDTIYVVHPIDWRRQFTVGWNPMHSLCSHQTPDIANLVHSWLIGPFINENYSPDHWNAVFRHTQRNTEERSEVLIWFRNPTLEDAQSHKTFLLFTLTAIEKPVFDSNELLNALCGQLSISAVKRRGILTISLLNDELGSCEHRLGTFRHVLLDWRFFSMHQEYIYPC
jgi:hypothetical protein